MKQYRQVAGKSRSALPSFLLGEGPDRQNYTLIDSYCDDPTCKGYEAWIGLVPDREPRTPLGFRVNLQEGTLVSDSQTREDDGKVGLAFVEDQLPLLMRRRQIVRAYALSKSRRKVELEAGVLCTFQEFRTTSESFVILFQHEGRRWSVLDAYCPNLDCDCAEVMLSIFAEPGEEKVLYPRHVVILDLKTGKMMSPDKDEPHPEASILAKTFLDSLGDWVSELSLRRSFLRRLVKRRGRFVEADPPGGFEALLSSGSPLSTRGGLLAPRSERLTESRRPPRNRPCPCGSGRKYKNCCGANDS